MDGEERPQFLTRLTEIVEGSRRRRGRPVVTRRTEARGRASAEPNRDPGKRRATQRR